MLLDLTRGAGVVMTLSVGFLLLRRTQYCRGAVQWKKEKCDGHLGCNNTTKRILLSRRSDVSGEHFEVYVHLRGDVRGEVVHG